MAIPSLDVLVALVTLYIVLALTVSAFTEVLTRIVGLRSVGLKSGIRSILQDPTTKSLASDAQKFWNNGIIKSATDGDSSPTSLDALTFATAALSSVAATLPRNIAEAKSVIAKSSINEHFKEVLSGLADRAMQRGTSLQDELAQHFDATMDKIGRWYRHWTQGISFAAAACLTVYLNANSLELLHQLTAHPEARLELAKIQAGLTPEEKAYAASKRAGQGESQGSSPSGAEDRSYDNAVDQLADAYKIVTKDTLGGDFEWPDGWSARVRLMCGLLITVLAVGLGAPFWFDVLGRISPKAGAADRPPSSVSVLPIPAVPAPASQAGTVAVQGSATD